MADIPITTGEALRAALWQAGLAPPGVLHPFPDLYVWDIPNLPWEPWRNIADCWHLVLRYRLRIELDYCNQGTWVWHESQYERATDDADIVSAIGRLSLRLHQADLAREDTP